jgi:hypothetical protein
MLKISSVSPRAQVSWSHHRIQIGMLSTIQNRLISKQVKQNYRNIKKKNKTDEYEELVF